MYEGIKCIKISTNGPNACGIDAKVFLCSFTLFQAFSLDCLHIFLVYVVDKSKRLYYFLSQY